MYITSFLVPFADKKMAIRSRRWSATDSVGFIPRSVGSFRLSGRFHSAVSSLSRVRTNFGFMRHGEGIAQALLSLSDVALLVLITPALYI